MTNEQRQIVESQVQEWTAEIKRLASQIAEARGIPSAIVMITPRDEDYADVVPELIAEDALQVHRDGWPTGFDIEVPNRADSEMR